MIFVHKQLKHFIIHRVQSLQRISDDHSNDTIAGLFEALMEADRLTMQIAPSAPEIKYIPADVFRVRPTKDHIRAAITKVCLPFNLVPSRSGIIVYHTDADATTSEDFPTTKTKKISYAWFYLFSIHIFFRRECGIKKPRHKVDTIHTQKKHIIFRFYHFGSAGSSGWCMMAQRASLFKLV